MQSTEVRRLPDAVLWHEGMLLAPQHFQQAHLRGEELLNYRVLASAPFAWGVRRLQVHPGMLAQGTFHVTDIEAVLPDGVVATGRGWELQTALADYEDAARREKLMVYLVVPAARGEGEPFMGQLPRYDPVESDPVSDDNTGDGEIRIRRLRSRLSLVAGEVPPGNKYVSLPLARVGFRDGAFVLAGFVPPLLAVDLETEPSRALAVLCANTARRMRAKALLYADRLAARPGGAAAAELHAGVRALVAQLPRLDALVSLRRAHPLELYLALCDAAGALAGLEGHVPDVFGAYDHDDLLRTFEPVLAYCDNVLQARREVFSSLPFEWRDEVFQVVPPAVPPAGRPYLVGVRAGALSEADAAAWMEGCRIASASRMASLLDRRFSGAVRKPLPATGDLATAAGAGMTLWGVDADPEFIVPGEPLQLALSESERRGRPAGLLLYTRNPAR